MKRDDLALEYSKFISGSDKNMQRVSELSFKKGWHEAAAFLRMHGLDEAYRILMEPEKAKEKVAHV